MHVQEYLDAVFDTLKKFIPKETFDKIHEIAIPVDILKGVTPFRDLPLADRELSWDGTQADKNIRAWAGGDDKEKIDWNKYSKGFLWVNDENKESFGGYKFPIADVIDGTLTVVPRGIFAAAAVLNGARLSGGTAQINVPSEDIQGMKNHIDRYYAKMRSAWDDEGLVSPFSSSEEKESIKEATTLIPMVKSSGKENSEIAFVGASPGKIEYLRGEAFVGPCGETFNELYIKPLGLKREDVFLTNAVPMVLVDEHGDTREPLEVEMDHWKEWINEELERANPKVIVALGQKAKKALGEDVDFVLPHPMAIRRFRDSGEVGRKLKQIKSRLDEINKGLPSVGDVHIPSTGWKRPKRAKLGIQKDEVIYADIIKADVEKQLVYGIVLEPGSVDAQNDTISADEIERAAHVYLQDSRIVGESHKAKARANVVESYLAPVDFTLGGQNITKGTWVMAVKIKDEKTWNSIKEKKFNGFSIGGFSRRIPVDKPVI
jgi:uracil-DNA glycosylase family 4